MPQRILVLIAALTLVACSSDDLGQQKYSGRTMDEWRDQMHDHDPHVWSSAFESFSNMPPELAVPYLARLERHGDGSAGAVLSLFCPSALPELRKEERDDPSSALASAIQSIEMQDRTPSQRLRVCPEWPMPANSAP